ncbi:MAG: sugar phosphate isomerase/epimerase family protein [Caldilinea sp.]|uniref:sugar phosphate isomerase/epimerase family protein n=1 Tax=Caldilinea sp. TaxID=2293560 RepID=UPI002BF6A296|nr:sugar phosphate isomerase/epimerase family protein [Caldilinea sp.]HRA67994.1 sugar phosphate isomerase/epimerase family protein [Caldilinea sp.]
MLALTSDYITDHSDPEPYLRALAKAGFTHVHWCHQWRSDFLYADSEIAQIGRWLRDYGLKLNDVHGSEGIEKFWYAPQEYARLAGIELVKNRIHLAEQLGGDAVVMHVYPPTVQPKLSGFNDFLFDQIRRSLDDLEVYARECGVRIALENLIDFAAVEAGVTDMAHAGDNADLLARLLAAYAPEFLGFCFDSGHAVLGFDRTARYAPLFDRLAVLHLHDNDGVNDLHLPVGDGVVNWADVAALVVASPYTKPLSFELSIRHTRFTEAAPFLAYSMAGCRRFAEQVARLRTQAQT